MIAPDLNLRKGLFKHEAVTLLSSFPVRHIKRDRISQDFLPLPAAGEVRKREDDEDRRHLKEMLSHSV